MLFKSAFCKSISIAWHALSSSDSCCIMRFCWITSQFQFLQNKIFLILIRNGTDFVYDLVWNATSWPASPIKSLAKFGPVKSWIFYFNWSNENYNQTIFAAGESHQLPCEKTLNCAPGPGQGSKTTSGNCSISASEGLFFCFCLSI